MLSQENFLSQISKMSTIVVDSANLDEINLHNPIDATTNPSSVLKEIEKRGIQTILKKEQIELIVRDNKSNQNQSKEEIVELIYDHLLIELAGKILAKLGGYVSVEVDAEFAYDEKKTLKRAKRLVELAKQKNLDYQRILIKIASTWQGIEVAKTLEKESIHCNLTLIFNFYQALACARANAHTISPFVGRILDWHQKHNPKKVNLDGNNEPGVLLVRQIYQYFKKEQLSTIVMAASFRNLAEIMALIGSDKLTIHPNLLNSLNQTNETEGELKANILKKVDLPQKVGLIDESFFNQQLNQDKMAKELLANGVAGFAKDTITLKNRIQNLIGF